MKSFPVGLFAVFALIAQSYSIRLRECRAPSISNRVTVIRSTNLVSGRGYTRSYYPGGSIEYRCASSYVRASGTSVIRCKNDGSWSGQPLDCKFTRVCTKPVTPMYSYISRRSTTSAQLRPGEYLTYKCLAGYSMRGSPTIRCQTGGSWTGSAPRCVKGTVYG